MRRSRIQSVGCGKEKECSEDKENRRIYGVVAFVAFSCYFNGLHGDLVHDDIPAVKQNKDVLGISPLFDIFKNDFWGTSMGDPLSHKSYRPLTVFTFRANYWLFGLQPFWYHVCNVALHAIASLLFTRVCLAVAGLKPKFAGMAGALFAAHPIHTEAVTGIVGRADVLACVFFLLSFLAYHGQTSPDGSEPGHISGLSVWLSVLLGGLSMLAKETGITVMGVNLAYDLYRCWPYIKRTIVEIRWNEETLHFSRRAAKVLISLCLLLVFRLALLQGSLPRFSSQDNPTAFHPCRHVRFLTFCYLAAFNCWLLLCPSTLSHDWQMGSVPLVTSLGDSRNVATCIFFLTFILLAYKGIADFEQQRHPPLLLGCLFLVLPFLPAANLIVTVGFVVAERVLFIPSLGFVLLVVYGVQLMWSAFLRQRSLLLCAGLLLLLFFCSRTIVRNRDWTTRDSLIRAGLKSLPHNAKMHYNFANYLRDSGNFDQAVKHYKEALRLWPSYASAHNNLGTLMSETEEAEGHFLAAIRHSPNHVNAHYNLGQVYRKVNRTEDAVRMLNRCILLDTSYAPAYLLLVKLYTSLGREKAVGKLLKRLTVLEPENPDNLAEYGSWLYRSGRSWEALNYFRKALASSSNHKSSLLGIANILRSKGHHVQAQLIMRRAYFLSKEHRTISYDVDIYIRNGKLENIMYDRQEPAQSLPKQQHTFGRPPCGQMARQSHQHKQMKKKKKKSSDSRAMHLVNKTTAAREACTLAAASCVTGLSPHVDIAGHSTGTAAFNQGYHYSFWNHQQMALPDDPLLVPESPTRSSGELDVLCMGSFQDEEFSQELMTG